MGIIKDFKEKDCQNWWCLILQLILFNNYVKIIVLASLAIFGATGIGILNSDSLFFLIPFNIGLIGLILFAIVAIISAFINPIKKWFE